ncbi:MULTISPECIES: carboxypeptidase regulatory-like domain-containing protein [unclassified Schlesneria]|uniref:carboxypeptidase regulatory-like domain-containing protein n=1 Tax=Schlesneria TaxID=656899 RepID=UPI002EF0F8E1
MRFDLRVPFAPVCVLALSLLLAGCSGNKNIASVTGTVYLDGEPLPKAFLIFTPQEGAGAPSFGRTDNYGRYQMIFSTNTKGAWIGRNRVTISTADAISPEKTTPEVVPSRYNQKSELYEEVEPGSNQIDFDLEGDGHIKKELPYTG